MKTKYSYNNNEITLNQKGEKVFLKGWIERKRNLGNKLFIDLRDVSGIVQLVVLNNHPQYQQIALTKIETVIDVKGAVIERINKNPNLTTGEIEVLVQEMSFLSEAENIPLSIVEKNEALEDYRLKYRYLDLRKKDKKSFLIQRHEITQNIRQTLLNNKFFELETPLLSKSTPEGARDYLVPSRIHPHHFYALPQSPQIYKQLYMISGFERYFQIARCFRDEDLRSDRQPEFTQIDIETSFFSQEDLINLTEEIMTNLFAKILNKPLPTPLGRLSFQETMNLYGSDKPDLRFDLKIEPLKTYFKEDFVNAEGTEKTIKGIKLNSSLPLNLLTRKKIDEYKHLIKNQFNLNLNLFKKKDNTLKGNLSQFVNDASFLEEGEWCFVISNDLKDLSSENHLLKTLGFLRNKLGHNLNLIDPNQESLLWIVDFPLFEFNSEDNRYYAMHHPFTASSDINILEKHPEKAQAQAYDLVWNGYEIGGGSLRNYQSHVQELMFQKLGFSKEEVQNRFGFLIEALKYGTPPHGGIALGLDRLVMLFTKTNNIKNVIAFPKTQSAQDLMMETPNLVDQEQLDVLNIQLKKDAEKK
ncbi:MAG: aspartyl-tRNA synthetase [Candidatus Phytoplasma pruni]|uniref:aspartate--tRNA ligase n=1 Tax=Poinsettia branch-inducing phytoplasma TaxID=138647 RepID=UPI00037CBA26|nr:aspartate--tRNA ligase [Poinsettia branch-inducing phytoplasma]WEK82202.1 MAG: aspartyl-tRNA synthetase [Candidatus Phytoplasma pruni]